MKLYVGIAALAISMLSSFAYAGSSGSLSCKKITPTIKKQIVKQVVADYVAYYVPLHTSLDAWPKCLNSPSTKFSDCGDFHSPQHPIDGFEPAKYTAYFIAKHIPAPIDYWQADIAYEGSNTIGDFARKMVNLALKGDGCN
jgi:hypothetical protein